MLTLLTLKTIPNEPLFNDGSGSSQLDRATYPRKLALLAEGGSVVSGNPRRCGRGFL